jgi:hypothetical protein
LGWGYLLFMNEGHLIYYLGKSIKMQM